MFSFIALWNWIHQSLLFKFLLSSYRFIFTIPISTTTHDSILPNELITDILLRLPTKSLLKCMSVSKSWHRIISSPDFVKNHLKIAANDKEFKCHSLIFGNLKFYPLPPLFNKKEITDEELFYMDPLTLSAFFVGSVNGLICLCNDEGETYTWNPTISKAKKLLDSPLRSFSNTKFGFGYDKSRDDYKVVFINYSSLKYYENAHNVATPRIVVYIYSLRSETWTTLHDQLQGIFLTNTLSKHINRKLYWISCNRLGHENVISFDITHETWGSLELPICGQDIYSNFVLGVVGSDLSVIFTSDPDDATSDIWILKDCGFWTKLFTIDYSPYDMLIMYSPTFYTFSIHFHESDILLLFPPSIMIFDGSTRQLKHCVDVEGSFYEEGYYHAEEIYIESIVNPLTISDQGRRIHEISESLS